MGKIRVAFAGKPLFEWEGDTTEVKNVEDAIQMLAAQGNVEPEALVHGVMRGIARRGNLLTSDQKVEMMAVIYFLLRAQTHHPDHPGLYRDYVPVRDFTFDIYCNEAASRFTVHVKGSLGDLPTA